MGKVLKLVITGVRTVGIGTLVAVSKTRFFIIILPIILIRVGQSVQCGIVLKRLAYFIILRVVVIVVVVVTVIPAVS